MLINQKLKHSPLAQPEFIRRKRQKENKMFVKKGDKVRVTAGKDKGVEAVVLTLFQK